MGNVGRAKRGNKGRPKAGKDGIFKGENKFLAFMDIGGITAEEVNNFPLKSIEDNIMIENFGWRRSLVDGKAGKGTFYVEQGNGFVLGTEPKYEGNAPL
eukprot:11575122-Ditylum_brightwellii.AAC.1